MAFEIQNIWINYKTGKTDYLPQGASLSFTPEQAKSYIPQDLAAQGMFDCLIAMGWKVNDAMIYVLEASAGIEHTKKVEKTA